MTFVERLRLLIAESPDGLNGLARRAGIDSGVLSKTSRGDGGRGVRTSYETVSSLARATGVRAEWLWSGEAPRERDVSTFARWRDHEAWDAVVAECRRLDSHAPWDLVGEMSLPPGCTPTVRAVLSLGAGVAEALRVGDSQPTPTPTPAPGSTVREARARRGA